MNAKLHGSSSSSDEIDIQGNDSQSYGGVQNQTHACVKRVQTDHAKMSDKMTLGMFAYNISVPKLRGRCCRRFLDPDVIHAIMILQKFQHNRFVPLNLTPIAGPWMSTLLAQVFGRKLNLGMLRVFTAISGQPLVDFVVTSPQPKDRLVVRTDFVFEIRGHCGEVFFAFHAAKEMADVFSDA